MRSVELEEAYEKLFQVICDLAPEDSAVRRHEKTLPAEADYVNAKVVLLGDSGVGKSGLGIRIAEGRFRETSATHGAWFWQVPVKQSDRSSDNVQAELTLWDLAGQPEYRLVHQLFLDDVDVALLLFDGSDPTDPFRGVSYWAKMLEKHAPPQAVKFLVAARSDVAPIRADRREINRILGRYGLFDYWRASAVTGEGIEALAQQIVKHIPWNILPHSTMPALFKVQRCPEFYVKAQGKR
ncbi:MAG: GTP-binding protein [Gammaproteobacteria bacterium]|nr:GTP-binding protein [Gammaproteobacteria bacterium]